jgi:hypothetical protein
MAFVTPTNVAPGNVLTASRYNQDVVENMDQLAPFFSAWSSWTPVLKQGTTTFGFTNTRSRYLSIGKMVMATTDLTVTSGTGQVNQRVSLEFGTGGTALPTAASSAGIGGSFMVFDAGNTIFAGYARGNGTAAVQFNRDGNGNDFGIGDIQMTTNDTLRAMFIYEAA